MIKIIICDDDLSWASLIKNELKEQIAKGKYGDYEYEFNIYDNSAELLKFSPEIAPDIAFLDIDMPGINGFDIASTFNKKKTCKIIFVSGFENYVYTSIKFKPLRFVRKSKITNELYEAFEAAMEEIMAESGYFSLGKEYCYKDVRYAEVVYIEAIGNYVNLLCKNGEEYRYRSSVSQLEKDLSSYFFSRSHSGFIVNMREVNYLKGNEIIMSNNTTLKLSRKYISTFRDAYYRFLRGGNI